MTPETGPAPWWRHPQALLLGSFAALVLASKLVLIAAFGTATPFQDQWAAEGEELYLPWAHGTLGWQDLLAAHHEHRIVLTRLLNLGLFIANGGVWNPLLQMAVNALLHTAALSLLLLLLLRACPPQRQKALWLFTTLLCAVPLGITNTLWGFQSQIYLVLLFSVPAFWLLGGSAPLGHRWWLGAGCIALAYLSFGAGVATLMAASLLLLLRWGSGRQQGWRAWLAFYLLALPALLAVLNMPPVEPTLHIDRGAVTLGSLTEWFSQAPVQAPRLVMADPRARSLAEFLVAFFSIASWPTYVLGPLLYFPLARFFWQRLRQPPAADDTPAWFLLGLGLWVLLVAASIAYGRASAPVGHRYADFYVIGLLLNLALLLRDADGDAVRRRWLRPLWSAVVIVAVLVQGGAIMSLLTGVTGPGNAAAEQRIRGFLQNGDASLLQFPEQLWAPTSGNPELLRYLLDLPGYRQLLPPNLVPENAARQAGWVDWMLANLHDLGLLLAMLGFYLGWRAWRGDEVKSAAGGG